MKKDGLNFHGAAPITHEEAWPTTAQSRHLRLGIGTPLEYSSMKYNRSCLHVRLCCRDGEAMRFHFLLKAL